MIKIISRYTLLLGFLLCMISTSQAQTFGVRAGVNYSTHIGPQLNGESTGYSSGFHFGISYGYQISDLLTIRTEISYIQNGTKYDYDGNGFYVIRSSEQTVFEDGTLDMSLDNSLGYLSIPVVMSGKIGDKWSVNGGLYMNFLVSPVGNGELYFSSHDRPDMIQFIQSLDYQYNDDKVLQGRRGTINPIVDLGDEKVTLFRNAGAYYQYAEKEGNLYNTFDAGVTAGVEYFINKGFYIGLSADYGLIDVTNNDVDYHRDELNDNNSFKFSDDNDTHFGIKMSIGFRF